MDDPGALFLLVQFRQTGRTDVTEFDVDDYELACTTYFEVEKRYAAEIHNRDVDALLVGASSLEDVKQSYPTYFMDFASSDKIIQRLLADLDRLCQPAAER